MNSSFNLKDGWTSGNQYDIGVVQYLTNPGPELSPGLAKKSSSSISDEFKILVEPSLFAHSLDSGKLSNQVERLLIEPYLLYISSELLTSQLLAREEKRQQKLQQAISDNKEDVVEENLSFAGSTATIRSQKRKRLQENTDKVKKLKVSENPTPTRQQPIIQAEQLNPEPMHQQKSDTVVVRLTSGQVVRVPRALLEKLNPGLCRTSAVVNQGSVTVTVCDGKRDQAVRLTDPSFTELPVNVSLGQALEILRGTDSSEDVVNQSPIRTNGLVKQLPEHGSSRFIKIRAYQGPPTVPAAVDSASLSEQLTKIQEMPQTHVVPRPTVLQTSQHQSTTRVPLGFHMTRIVQQQRPQNMRRRNLVISAAVPVVQIRPSQPQYVLTNGFHSSTPIQQSSQGTMKICFIPSPRKADGTPLSPGSPSPGVFVMNPPSNLRQINLNEVLKAFSMQNAATTAVAKAAKL